MAGRQCWYLRRRESSAFVQQHAELHPLVAKVLHARKIDTPHSIRAFLQDDDQPGDPSLMAGMDRAVARIRGALEGDEQIVVYGDFDADGVSATVLLVHALRGLGGRVTPYIPDRFSEAYGLNKAALRRLRQQGASLVVTVDCGIRSAEEVACAQAQGLDVIVTDHHTVPEKLPPALAVIDPKRSDCPYPFKELAGVGVAHRLVDALFSSVRSQGMAGSGQSDLDQDQYLDLVALGTVSDIVPLTGENRILVRQGLARMQAAPRLGLRALLEIAGVDGHKVDSQAIAFRLGPRVNAAGRLRSAMLAYELLATESADEAQRLSVLLSEINVERQQLLGHQVERARELLGDDEGRRMLVIDDPDFHVGIVGLVASRLTDEFYRPSLVMRRGRAATRGSARSIEGFHITHALDACSDLLSRYGGHARAGGFSLPSENLGAFRERLESYAAQNLTEEMLTPHPRVDAIVSLEEITEDTPAALSRLEPFGQGNPEPALATAGLRVLEMRAVGREGRHLRMTVSDGHRSMGGIAFRQGHRASEFVPGDMIDLIYQPTQNEWQGRVSLQLVVQAMRRSSEGGVPGSGGQG